MRFFKKITSYLIYYGPVGSAVNLARLAAFSLKRALGKGKYVVRRINGRYDMYLDVKGQGISRPLYIYGTRERDQVSIVLDELKEGMRVLDIGANIGYYALLEAGIVGKTGAVYAYEPHPDNVELLRKNIELNNFSDRIRCHEVGVSDRDGKMEFFISRWSNLHTFNPVSPRNGARKGSFTGSVMIEVVDIARLLRRIDGVDFLRMDIEGHEVEVLGKLCEALDTMKVSPSILFETHFSKYDDNSHSMKGALMKLFDKGYIVKKIVSNNESKNPLQEKGYKPEKIIRTDLTYRGIYRDVNNNDALHFICDTGGIRAVLLKRKVRSL